MNQNDGKLPENEVLNARFREALGEVVPAGMPSTLEECWTEIRRLRVENTQLGLECVQYRNAIGK